MYKKSKKMQWGDPTSRSDANFAKGQLVKPNRHICVMCLEQAVEEDRIKHKDGCPATRKEAC